jgi:hypothetical protein
MGYRLEAGFRFHRTEADDPMLNEFLDRVDIQLDSLGAKDVAIISDAEDSTFLVALWADGESDELAFSAALRLLRQAFHNEDCETPDWPRWAQFLSAGISKKEPATTKAAA